MGLTRGRRATVNAEDAGRKTKASRERTDELPNDGVDEDDIWRLAAALSSAVTSADVAVAVAESGAAAAGAAFSNLGVHRQDTGMLAVVHGGSVEETITNRWAEFEVDERTPLGDATRLGLPVLLGSIEEIAASYPALAPDTVASGLAATASLPLLTAEGAILGAIGFGWSEPRQFGVRAVRRLDLIARISAQALERALLYERDRAQISAADRAEARLLQEAFLPATLPRTEHLEVAAAYLPASDAAMGGDWYDAFPVDNGTCLVIGDVAGHGLRSAAVMAQLRNATRAFADEDASPSRVLGRLNRMLCRLEPEETATAIVCVWDPEHHTLWRSSAGHPPPLRCRPGEFSYLVPPDRGVILGVDPDWQFHEVSKLLRPGTTLLFYTDGLVEARGESLEDGMDGLKTFVEQLEDLTPQALCDAVLKWRLGAATREDDMCLLAVRLA